jgi:hypothetical protein
MNHKKGHKNNHNKNNNTSDQLAETSQQEIQAEPVLPNIDKDIVQTNEPGVFHEGHYKDIPDQKDFISHEELLEKQDIAEKHLTGEETHGGSEHKQGIWDKAKHLGTEVKDALFDGASKVKNFFTG